MSIFVCGFNSFKQVLNSELIVAASQSAVTKPYAVSFPENLSARVTPVHGSGISDSDGVKSENVVQVSNQSESVIELLGNVSDLKDVIISWDMINYLWKSGCVTFVGGQLSCMDFGFGLTMDSFHGFNVQSLCTSQHSLLGIDANGNCMTLTQDCRTSPVQLNWSQEDHCGMGQNPTAIFASESGSIVLLGRNRRVAFGDLQKKTSIHLRELKFELCVKSVSCGKHHTLLLSAIGMVFSFGNGSQGQLGHGTVDSQAEPRILEVLEGMNIVQIAAGGWHSVSLSDIGDVYIWGWNEKGQLGLPCQNLRGCNSDFTANIMDSSTDSESSPNVDKGLTGDSSRFPKFVKPIQGTHDTSENFVNIQTFPAILDFPVEDPDSVYVSKIACGSRHTVAVLEDGRAYSWGCNNYGQLGHGDTKSRDQPELIQYFVEQKLSVDRVFGGFWNTVFVIK